MTLPAAGSVLTLDRTLTQTDFDRFAAISGDDNPIHVDPEFSGRTRFGRTVSHGMLLYTVFWGLLRRHLPGWRQAAQTLMFPAPAYADEGLTFTATVTEAGEGRVALAIRVFRIADGITVCEGQAIMTNQGNG